MFTLAIIGHPDSGKSHFAALLYLHLNKVAERRKLRIKVNVDSQDFNIKETANGLRYGTPLAPTPPGRVYKSELIVDFPGLFKDKRIHMPIIDVAGSSLEQSMLLQESAIEPTHDYQLGDRETGPEKLSVNDDDERNSIYGADVYCFVINVAKDLRQGRVNVEYNRFYQNLRAYRQAHFLGSPKWVSLIFTKVDECEDELKTKFGPYFTADNLSNYLTSDLLVELSSTIYTPIKSFLSFTRWSPEKNERTAQKQFAISLDGASGQPVPVYPQDTYDEIVEWIYGF